MEEKKRTKKSIKPEVRQSLPEVEGDRYSWYWVCSECHTRINWHTETCPECKRRIDWHG